MSPKNAIIILTIITLLAAGFFWCLNEAGLLRFNINSEKDLKAKNNAEIKMTEKEIKKQKILDELKRMEAEQAKESPEVIKEKKENIIENLKKMEAEQAKESATTTLKKKQDILEALKKMETEQK